MGQAKLIGDLHVFEHVLYGKMWLKIRLSHLRHFHCQSRGMTRVDFHCFDEFSQRDAQSSDQRQSFRRGLHTRGGDYICCDFDRTCLTDLAGLDNLLAARFKNGTRFPQCRIIPGEVINQFAFFRRDLTAGEWRFHKPCAAMFDHFRRGTH